MAEPEDDNPWDDDDGARTVATGAPMELPSNIPSPITNPPPAMTAPKQAPPPQVAMPKPAAVPAAPAPAPAPAAAPAVGVPGVVGRRPPPKAGKATMIGIAGPAPGAVAPPGAQVPAAPVGPSSPRAPAPASAQAPQPARPATAPSSARGPAAAPPPLPSAARRPSVPERAEVDEDENDGPTVAGAPSGFDLETARADVLAMREAAAGARRPSPMASTGFAPGGPAFPPGAGRGAGPNVDKDAETQALPGSAVPIGPGHAAAIQNEQHEETTRAVGREELLRGQDAHVIVGEDAVGDEATLAVAPGQVDLGPNAEDFQAAFKQTLEDRRPASAPELPPAFPPPPAQAPFGGTPGSNPHVQAAQPPSWPGMQGHPPPPPPYDPMMPQQQPMGPGPHGYPPSGPQAISYPGAPPSSGMGPMGGYSPMGAPPMSGSGTQAMVGAPVAPPHPNAGMYGGNAQPPPPWMQQAPPPGAGSGVKLSPQVIMLAAVGTVSLAIFIVGIYLFVTANR